MSETLDELKNVVDSMADLKAAVDREKQVPEKLKAEIVRLCQEILKAVGEDGGYGYPQPEGKKGYDEDRPSAAVHYFGH